MSSSVPSNVQFEAEPEWPCDPIESVFAETREGLLTEADWRLAIHRILEATDPEQEARFASRRREGGDRYFRQAPCMLRTELKNGLVGVHLVTTRNLSRGGLSVLHGEALEVGASCVLALQPPEGPGMVMNASVEWCRSIDPTTENDGQAYEIGLRFQSELDVTPFLESR
ncbi:MAG: PilZ domain-containing protein [Algisphaera sp.]